MSFTSNGSSTPKCISKIACNLCNKSIVGSTAARCDGCGNSFHDVNSSNPDLILLCEHCSNDHQIYEPSDQSMKKKERAISAIPTLNSSNITKALRSRTIIVSNGETNHSMQQQKQMKSARLSNSTTTKKDECDFEKRVSGLEARLLSMENTPCNCMATINAKIAVIERTINENHEFVVDHLKYVSQNRECASPIIDSTVGKSEINESDNLLHDHLNLNDKIADIERTIKEDRLLVEQLYVNQMENIKGLTNNKQAIDEDRVWFEHMFTKQLDLIQNRLKTQEETIKSCEAFFELEATNDSLVRGQFAELKKKNRNIEKALKVHSKLLRHLNNITERHQNTIITHFNLNSAYCTDLVSTSKSILNELSSCDIVEYSSKGAQTTKHTNTQANHTQTEQQVNHSNNACTQSKSIEMESASVPAQLMTSPIEETNGRADGSPQHEQQMQHCETANTIIANERMYEQKQSNVFEVHTRALKYGKHNNNSKIRINIKSSVGFDRERDIRKIIGNALISFSEQLGSGQIEMFTNKIKYDSLSRKISNCTFILLLPCPIDLLNFDLFFNRFLSQSECKPIDG